MAQTRVPSSRPAPGLSLSQVSPYPEPMRLGGFATVGGDAYVVAGVDGGGSPKSSVYRFDLSSGWVQEADFPSFLAGDQFACAGVGDYVYLSDANVTFRYDTNVQEWEAITDPPTRYSEAAGWAYDGEFYVCGGTEGSLGGGTTVVDDVVKYTPEDDAWTVLADMPAAKANHDVAVLGNYAYAVAGEDGSQSSATTVFRYNHTTDLWDTVAEVDEGNVGPVVGSVGGQIYKFAGYLERPQPEVYYPETDAWEPLPFTWNVDFPAGGAWNGGLLIVGGQIGNTNAVRQATYYS